jgi:hypothetical protein
LGATIKPRRRILSIKPARRLLLTFDIQNPRFCNPAEAMKTSTHAITALFLGCLPLAAQNSPTGDPFVRNAATKAAPTESSPKFVSICYEMFSLDLSEAAALYRQKLSDGKIYAELTARVAKGKAKQESFAIVRVKSGQKAHLENLTEFIYPTEFIVSVPQGSAAPAPAAPARAASAPAASVPIAPAPVAPSSFETRNIGFNLEVEATMSEDNQIVDVRLSPETVTLVDRVKWGQGISQTEMPIFESQRVTTALTLVAGQPGMVGTPSRPPVSKVDADSANRVWFSFVTADVISVIKE